MLLLVIYSCWWFIGCGNGCFDECFIGRDLLLGRYCWWVDIFGGWYVLWLCVVVLFVGVGKL